MVKGSQGLQAKLFYLEDVWLKMSLKKYEFFKNGAQTGA